jgi:hypothetical protein
VVVLFCLGFMFGWSDGCKCVNKSEHTQLRVLCVGKGQIEKIRAVNGRGWLALSPILYFQKEVVCW